MFNYNLSVYSCSNASIYVLFHTESSARYIQPRLERNAISGGRIVGLGSQLMIIRPMERADRKCGEGLEIKELRLHGRIFLSRRRGGVLKLRSQETKAHHVPAENSINKETWRNKTSKLFIKGTTG